MKSHSLGKLFSIYHFRLVLSLMIWKLLKLCPFTKKDNPEIFSNYRPVLLLPCFSKILERIVHERCYSFLSNNSILYKRQYEFRSCHSTYMAVLDFIKEMNIAIDSNNVYRWNIYGPIKGIRYNWPWYSTAKATSLWFQRGIQWVVYKLPLK